jgi:hypothetical protein
MTLQDILLEQKIDQIRKLDTAWVRFQAEAVEQERQHHRGMLRTAREGLAGMLVRLGAWIDRAASERAIRPTPR